MSRFESGCRRFMEMYPNWRRDLPRKQTGRNTDVGVQIPPSPLCSRSPSGRGIRFKPGHGRVQIPPGVHTLVPERHMDPAKDRRFAGSNPAKGIFRYVAQWKTRCAQATVREVAGSVSAPLRSALSVRPPDAQRPAIPISWRTAATEDGAGSNPLSSTLITNTYRKG